METNIYFNFAVNSKGVSLQDVNSNTQDDPYCLENAAYTTIRSTINTSISTAGVDMTYSKNIAYDTVTQTGNTALYDEVTIMK